MEEQIEICGGNEVIENKQLKLSRASLSLNLSGGFPPHNLLSYNSDFFLTILTSEFTIVRKKLDHNFFSCNSEFISPIILTLYLVILRTMRNKV